jgi:fumarate reductase flavoprotein subunit
MGVVPGITMTLGGTRVDGSAAVIGATGRPVPGLYAAGQTVGGLHSGPGGGYVGGLAPALALAYVAARSIAAYIEGSPTDAAQSAHAS